MSTKTKVMSLICIVLSVCVIVIVTNATDRAAAAGEPEHPVGDAPDTGVEAVETGV